MKEAINIAFKSLKRHPAGYTVIALVLVTTSVSVPLLPENQRIYALLATAIMTVSGVCYLQVREHATSTVEPKEKHKAYDVQVFVPNPTVRYNETFYTFFIDKIRTAKDIYITGDGFECANQRGTQLARDYIRAFREMLEKDGRVVRVETKQKSQYLWAEMLAGLVGDFKDRFELRILSEKETRQMASVCAINPDFTQGNTVEIMLSNQKTFGMDSADLAGTAVFIMGNQELAKDLAGRIRSLAERATRPKTFDEVINLMTQEEYYFSFGSNMISAQMKERCASAEMVDIGMLPDHQLVFNRRGTWRTGGVASVEPAQGKRVYGVIWRINPMEIPVLDDAEHCPQSYTRSKIDVRTMRAKVFSCQVYKAIPEGHFEADQKYLEEIIYAAKIVGLPSEYVDYLITFKSGQKVSEN